MILKDLHKKATTGDNDAITEIMNRYSKLVRKNSYVNSRFDEDCYQELNLQLLGCIKRFKYNDVHDVMKLSKELKS